MKNVLVTEASPEKVHEVRITRKQFIRGTGLLLLGAAILGPTTVKKARHAFLARYGEGEYGSVYGNNLY